MLKVDCTVLITKKKTVLMEQCVIKAFHHIENPLAGYIVRDTGDPFS